MQTLELEMFAEDFLFPEAPRWHEGHLWVPDVFEFKIHRLDMHGNRTVPFVDLPPRTNSIGFLSDGSLLVVASVSRQLLRFVDGECSVYADLSEMASGDLNDFAIDEAGRVYVGNFGYDHFAGADRRETDIHLIDADRSIRVAAGGLEFPNGTVIIDGGRTLVVAQSWRGLLTAFDRAEDGTLSSPRTFASLEGRNPDGICADAEGAIWVPSFNTGEVLRVLEGGEITHRGSVRGGAVACHLGGEDGRTLFVATYAGTGEECMAGKRLGNIQTTRVNVPCG